MAQLPPELWMDIIESYILQPSEHYAPPKKDIYNLSLTSYAFHLLAEPYIFRHFTIDMRNRPAIPKAQNVINYLHRRVEVRPWVQYLTIIGPPVGATTFAATKAFHQIWNDTRDILFDLSGLRGVRMTNVSLSRETHDHLFRRLQLREFEGDEVSFHWYGKHPPPTSLPNPSLRSIILRAQREAGQGGAGVTTLINHKLERLHYSTAYATSFQTNPAPHQPWLLENLRELEVVEPKGDTPSSNFNQFLHRCPNLKSLRVLPSRIRSGVWHTSEIDSHTIPQLQSYHGPWYYAGRMVQGRPVHDVRFLARNGMDAPINITLKILLPLLLSTVPIRTLHLKVKEWDDKGFMLIVALFPKLEELSITYWSGPYEPWKATFLAHVSKLVHLRKLEVLPYKPAPKDDRNICFRLEFYPSGAPVTGSSLAVATMCKPDAEISREQRIYQYLRNSINFRSNHGTYLPTRSLVFITGVTPRDRCLRVR